MRRRHFLQMRWQRSVHIFLPHPRHVIHFFTVSGFVVWLRIGESPCGPKELSFVVK